MKLGQPGWVKSLPPGVVVGIATLGVIGRRLPAPGTWGSLAGMCYFATVFAEHVDFLGGMMLNLVGIYFAVVFCGEAEVRLGRSDPGEVILDEFVAMPLCYMGWPLFMDVAQPWIVALVGFGLFRLFDIRKPFGIDRLQSLPGGWGVVADDLAAALATCLTMHAAHVLWLIVSY